MPRLVGSIWKEGLWGDDVWGAIWASAAAPAEGGVIYFRASLEPEVRFTAALQPEIEIGRATLGPELSFRASMEPS